MKFDARRPNNEEKKGIASAMTNPMIVQNKIQELECENSQRLQKANTKRERKRALTASRPSESRFEW